MSSTAPNIDNRDQKALASKIREYLVRFMPGNWSRTDAVSTDAQSETLLQLFARLVEIVNQRLNLVPDKYFLAFLEVLGIDLTPPTAARTELVFQATPQATSTITVPAGTQVSREGGSNTIVFETEADLVVLPFAPAVVMAHDPVEDRYSDYSFLTAASEASSSASIFTGTKKVTHRIYFGHEKLLAYDETVTVYLDIALKEEITTPPLSWEVQW